MTSRSSCAVKASVSASSVGGKAGAERAAAALLQLFVAPTGATRLDAEPKGDHGLLRRRTTFIGGESAARHCFLQVSAPFASAVAFVKSHPPAGSSRPGVGAGSYLAPQRTFDYDIGRLALPRPARSMEVTIVSLAPRSTGIRVDAIAGWIVPRSPRETLPAGVRRIDIHAPRFSARVTDRAKVREIVRRFNSLAIVQPGLQPDCPAPGFGLSRVALVFRSKAGVELARASLLGTLSTSCRPIRFSLGGKPQTPLVGLRFFDHVKQLLGIRR